jgi:hypothetical protein
MRENAPWKLRMKKFDNVKKKFGREKEMID